MRRVWIQEQFTHVFHCMCFQVSSPCLPVNVILDAWRWSAFISTQQIRETFDELRKMQKSILVAHGRKTSKISASGQWSFAEDAQRPSPKSMNPLQSNH